jgi:membrane protease YdiL (CAAX protease family)
MAAGPQLIARRDRPAERYRGPAPLILFALQVVAVNAISVVLFALGIPMDAATPPSFLVAALLLVGGYVVIVWLFVVRSGALSWRDIIRAQPLNAGRVATDIAIGIATMLAVAIVAAVIGGLIANVLGTQAPDVVPPPSTTADILLTIVAAGILVPIGEETFFRGYAMTAWLRDLGPRSALIRVTLLFALIHVFNITATTFGDGARQALLEVAVIGPVGLVLGLLYLRRGLIASISGHAAFNLLGLLAILLAQTPAGH